MNGELTRPLRRTAILFWILAAVFIAQMAWWITFQILHGREDLEYRERALRSEPSVALSRWQTHIAEWADSLRTEWLPLTQISAAMLRLDALDGWPGVVSARVASTDPERIRSLLSRLESMESPNSRRARFVCAICCCLSIGELIEVTGSVSGLITREPKGERGFGYDPIFHYPPTGRTFAELSAAE